MKNKTSPAKKALFQKASSREDENDVDLDDESDITSLEDENYTEGQFDVVKVNGRSRSKNFVDRIDAIEKNEFEVLFFYRE